jgi:hypothetical protein
VQSLPCFLHVLVDPILGDVLWTSSLFCGHFPAFFEHDKKHGFFIVMVPSEVGIKVSKRTFEALRARGLEDSQCQ